jgi:hypothetical protein
MTETVWVQRNDAAAICGVYANQQPGFADEELASDNPEVVAYLAPPPPEPTAQNELLYDHENRLRALEGQPPLTLGDFVARVGADVR